MSETIVVTGASAGLGRAIVQRFARDGSNIALIARGRDRLEAARAEVETAGARALVLPLDVADADAVEDAAARVEQELGPIDVWINNAMVSVYSPIKEMTPAEFRRVTDVTYLGYVHGTLAALKRMLPRDHGVIIQVGSALAHRSIPLQSAYCAAKHAIMGFHESLLSELIHDGSSVRATMVQMPAMNTPQFDWAKSRLPRQTQPVPPIFQPEVAARAIFFAAMHPERREVWVGTSTVKAIVANKIAPGLLDRYLADVGYSGQLTEERQSENAPANLFTTVDADVAAHGRFDEVATSYSGEMMVSEYRGYAAVALAGLFAFGLGKWFSRRR